MNRKKFEADGLWEYALRALAQRAHSLGELRRKLASRAASPEDVRATMEKLREYGLADDRRFAEAFSTSRLQNNGFGKLRILRDLRAKNVAAKVAEEAVRKTFDGIDEQELIERFLKRKYRGKDLRELLREPKHLNAAYRRLRMAGFSSAVAVGALRRYAEAAEELDGLEQE
ncbi:MAG: regulatory protein RecX [Bryobacteraceae bacterium]